MNPSDFSAISRRALLRWGVKTLVAAPFVETFRPAVSQGREPAKAVYRDAALRVARWLQANELRAGSVLSWPAVPSSDKLLASAELYSGVSGIVLFFLEAYHTTGNGDFLQTARGGADYLLTRLADAKAIPSPGLYTGLAGVGFALDRTFAASRDGKYRHGVEQCLRRIASQAMKSGGGVTWNETNDIIAGSAGIGLFLLYAARELQDPSYLDLAAQAGRRLLEIGIPEQGGRKWRMDAQFARLMPNFSHGTAGVGYFLASLHQATHEKAFLDGALAGARYLTAVAHKEQGGCLIFHHEPEGQDLFYLGWCHGPVGTARFFHRLYEATSDPQWLEWVRRCARSLQDSGLPEKQTPGFWNNAGLCCGLAGVADFFLSLYRVTKDPEYKKFSERVTAALLAQATPDRGGLKWLQAEHRIRPQEVVAQTGYMQGAAGIGILFLRLDALAKEKQPSITLPDSPF